MILIRLKTISVMIRFLDYPWTEIEIYGWAQLKRWLFLPDYINPPSAKQLIGKFHFFSIEMNIFFFKFS
jgi:hypothetical protein